MRRLRLAVIVVTKGRAEIVAQFLNHLAAQTEPPALLIFSATKPDDLAHVETGEQIFGSPGIAAQRNHALAQVAGRADIAVFFDDDFVPTKTSLTGIRELFEAQPLLAGATGTVFADGITASPIEDEVAAQIAAQAPATTSRQRRVTGLYGCNMAIRLSAARGLEFDEALPLYGWQEDLDFGARLSASGHVVRSSAFGGVHRGVRSARIGQCSFGYSQIANPVHLMRGQGRPVLYYLRLMARNLIANLLGTIAELFGRRSHWIDRRGRLRGNFLALADLVRGRLSPDRAANR
jgi:GT2 family glycosyltransferase